jgi:micrococcal nuclease
MLSKSTIIVSIATLLLLSVIAGCITQEYNSGTIDSNESEATVISVTDGDTVKLRLDNESEQTIRIYGIDTPETSSFGSSPGEFGVRQDSTQCLRKHGQEAKQFAKNKLLNKKVTLIQPPESTGDFGRRLMYLIPENSEKTYGEMVLSEGLSRVYDEGQEFDRLPAYENVESEAKIRKSGVWDCSVSDGNISIYEVRADSTGSDTENPTEFVEIANTGDSSSGPVTIYDESGHRMVIEQGIKPNTTTEIHTCEAERSDSIVWNTCSAVWNNNGDIVSVESSSSRIRLAY